MTSDPGMKIKPDLTELQRDEDKQLLSEIDRLNNANPTDEFGPFYWKPAGRPGFLRKVKVKGRCPARPDQNQYATVESEGRQDGPSVSVVPPRAAGSIERPRKKSKRSHSQAEEGELSHERRRSRRPPRIHIYLRRFRRERCDAVRSLKLLVHLKHPEVYLKLGVLFIDEIDS